MRSLFWFLSILEKMRKNTENIFRKDTTDRFGRSGGGQSYGRYDGLRDRMGSRRIQSDRDKKVEVRSDAVNLKT